MLFAMACYCCLKVLSFCSLHFRIAAKIRLDLVNQINPQCNSGSQWIYVRDESGSNIDVFFGRRKSKTTEEWIWVRWMVPQLCLAFLKEVFSFYAHSFFPRKCIPQLSLLLAPESWMGGAMQGAKGSPWWVGGYEAFWAAPESHSTEFPKKYGRSSFGDVQELQKELFGTGRVLWGANAASHLKVLAPAGTQVANVNSLSSAGLVLPKKQPCLENTIKNWP